MIGFVRPLTGPPRFAPSNKGRAFGTRALRLSVGREGCVTAAGGQRSREVRHEPPRNSLPRQGSRECRRGRDVAMASGTCPGAVCRFLEVPCTSGSSFEAR